MSNKLSYKKIIEDIKYQTDSYVPKSYHRPPFIVIWIDSIDLHNYLTAIIKEFSKWTIRWVDDNDIDHITKICIEKRGKDEN